MIRLNMPQGGADWLLIRAGMPTASQFSKVITPAKFAVSTSVELYSSHLLAELYYGGPIDSDSSQFMERGKELEAEALAWYELGVSEEVETTGFCMSDDQRYGCSPDALVGDEGGCEIKVPAMVTHLDYLIKDELPTKYLLQVQGSMLVTGRKWWDFVSWHPTAKPLVVRVKRDEDIILALQGGLNILCMRLDEKVEQLSEIEGRDIGIDKTEIIAKYKAEEQR